MAESMCPSLCRLAIRLTTAYRLRDNCLADKKDAKALAKAELDLRRVNHLITHHLSFCRHCRFNEALEGIQPRYRDSYPNVIPIDRVIPRFNES
jgi:hypothetical protein